MQASVISILRQKRDDVKRKLNFVLIFALTSISGQCLIKFIIILPVNNKHFTPILHFFQTLFVNFSLSSIYFTFTDLIWEDPDRRIILFPFSFVSIFII